MDAPPSALNEWSRETRTSFVQLDERHEWLLSRYFHSAWLILAVAAPILVWRGGWRDALAIGLFIGSTAVCWKVEAVRPRWGAGTHLVAMFPFWAWYSGMAGGLPLALGAGVSEYVILLLFPILTLVAVGGYRGAAAALGLGLAGLTWRFRVTTAWMEGLFLIGTSVLTGLVFRKLVLQLERAHTKLRHMAYHDPLSELPNRRELALHGREPLKGRGALLFVDLDRFKNVNDALGHAAGDEMLRMVAARVRESVPEEHLVARTGGDEFAVLFEGADEGEAIDLARRILARIEAPFELRGRVVHVGGSAGIAIWPDHGRDLEMLMQSADAALYRAKARTNPVIVHRPEHDDGGRTQRILEVDFRRALEREELVLYYQPVVDVVARRVVGAEALVRWRHPERGLLLPVNFVGFAEENGAIGAIDRWVLKTAAAQARVWGKEGFEGWIAVNVSARTLDENRLAADVKQVLAREQLDPKKLVLELTESAAVRDPDVTLQQLHDVHALGSSVAIDDFGMGYSSLAMLRRLPVQHLKIDRSFISGIGTHVRDEEMIELLLQLAARWRIEVIAEGVETAHQLAWLIERGCRLAQGFALARPMPVDRFLDAARALRDLPLLDEEDVSGARLSHIRSADVSARLQVLKEDDAGRSVS